LGALGINLGYLLVQILSFIIALLILRAWVYRPILNMLERRRKTIAQGLEDARLAAEARESAEKQAEAIRLEAEKEADEIVRQAHLRAEEVAVEVKVAAEKDAQGIRAAAEAEAEQSKQQAFAELRAQVAALSIAAAEKLVREALDGKRQRALIDEFFSGIKEGKLALPGVEHLAGVNAEITSALPLTAEEQNVIRKEIGGRIGAGSNITFRVDPGVLGGLVVNVGDRVLDGSVAGGLDSLRQSLK
jgi:F-type H+-transporting ATPase subunit b